MYEKFFIYLEDDKTPILPLPTIKLAKYFGNPSSSSKLLQDLVNLHLLEYKDKSYHFGDSKNRCRTYYVNKKMFKEISKYCKSSAIEPFMRVVSETDISDIPHKIRKKIKVGRNLSIPIKGISEAQIVQILTEKYPWVEELRKGIQKNNKRYDSPFFWDSCAFSFKYNKKHTKITKIGFRVSNSLCNKSKEERTVILNSLGIHNSDDVAASVLSFNLSLNQGRWRRPL